ncbi:DNA-binding transcriptional regulator, LysR family [Cupriavidus sp. YR651]|uniref:LysR family transcriptional regulator n=1 Tax=Cupriavidus sp. YR651 TaxID=1855315 RepID=UPI000880D97D|nr:LysR family transcriptional regulator [Cupriavidus sp. YR651]SDC69667.1 DNA-binding transcriptional regulator, LysR family [Cupriavidus sp. YR651]
MDQRKIEGLWTHLHWLVVLAENGSYTQAAARLGVSKAAMSQRIAELERIAGIPLVSRTTRSVRLTEAGLRLVEGTRQHYDEIALSFASIRDQAGAARGLVRVTAPVAFARQQLIQKLPAFLAENPEIRVEIDLSDRIASLATEGFDLAIRHSAGAPDTHVAIKLCESRSVVVATRDYLRRRGTPQSPADLSDHECLYYPRLGGEATWSFERRARKAGQDRFSLKVSGPFAANNSEALRDAALAGLGIALLPDFTAQAAIVSGKLVPILQDWHAMGAFADQLYLVRPYTPHVPRAVGQFVTYLRAQFADGFPFQAKRA